MRGLGPIVCPGHPLLRGVESFHGGSGSFRDVALLTFGAIPIAEWEDEFNFAAEMPGRNGRIIGLNFLPPSSDERDDYWDASTDGDLIMANALRYVMKPAFPFAKSIKLKQGEEDGGDLASLHRSDNDRYAIDAEKKGRGHGTNALITLAMPRCARVAELDLMIETGTDSNNVRTKVQMYDFDAKKWRTIDSFRQSRKDDRRVYRNITEPQRFVKPSGSVLVRVKSKRGGDYVFRIDRVAIRPVFH